MLLLLLLDATELLLLPLCTLLRLLPQSCTAVLSAAAEIWLLLLRENKLLSRRRATLLPFLLQELQRLLQSLHFPHLPEVLLLLLLSWSLQLYLL